MTCIKLHKYLPPHRDGNKLGNPGRGKGRLATGGNDWCSCLVGFRMGRKV